MSRSALSILKCKLQGSKLAWEVHTCTGVSPRKQARGGQRRSFVGGQEAGLGLVGGGMGALWRPEQAQCSAWRMKRPTGGSSREGGNTALLPSEKGGPLSPNSHLHSQNQKAMLSPNQPPASYLQAILTQNQGKGPGFPLRPPTLIHGQAPSAGLQASSAARSRGERASRAPRKRPSHGLPAAPAPASSAAGTARPWLPAPPNGDQEARRQHLKREIPETSLAVLLRRTTGRRRARCTARVYVWAEPEGRR